MAGERVLVVDDDDDIRTVATASLARLGGFRVEAVSGGAEAVERARAERPDAIVLDVMMPKVDGRATLAALRAVPELASVPVVFLTAKALPAERRALSELGVAGVLAKPFDPLTLPGELRALVGWSS